MQFIDFFTFGKIIEDKFSLLYDEDKIGLVDQPEEILLSEYYRYDVLFEAGFDEDLFLWEYGKYFMSIGFYNVALKITLSCCDDWHDQEKAAKAWWKPVKSVICKSKDDVTKTVKEMLEYVKANTQAKE